MTKKDRHQKYLETCAAQQKAELLWRSNLKPGQRWRVPNGFFKDIR